MLKTETTWQLENKYFSLSFISTRKALGIIKVPSSHCILTQSVRYGQEICILFSKTSSPSLGPTPPPLLWVRRFFPGNKAAGAWSSPPPSSSDVMKEWSYTFSPPTCLHEVGKDKFTFQSNVCTNSLHFLRLYFFKFPLDKQTSQRALFRIFQLKLRTFFFRIMGHALQI